MATSNMKTGVGPSPETSCISTMSQAVAIIQHDVSACVQLNEQLSRLCSLDVYVLDCSCF
jgi:hypothetical protein